MEREIRMRTEKTVNITENIALVGLHQDNFLASDCNIVNHLMEIAKMCIRKFRCGEA